MISSTLASPIKKDIQQVDSSSMKNLLFSFQDNLQNSGQFPFPSDSKNTQRQEEINQINYFEISKNWVSSKKQQVNIDLKLFPFRKQKLNVGESQEKQHNNLTYTLLSQQEKTLPFRLTLAKELKQIQQVIYQEQYESEIVGSS